MGIGLASVPNQLLRTGCAKNATRRGGLEKQILTAMPDREIGDEKQALGSPDERRSTTTMNSRRAISGN